MKCSGNLEVVGVTMPPNPWNPSILHLIPVLYTFEPRYFINISPVIIITELPLSQGLPFGHLLCAVWLLLKKTSPYLKNALFLVSNKTYWEKRVLKSGQIPVLGVLAGMHLKTFI